MPLKFHFFYSHLHRLQMDSANLYKPGKVTTRPYFRGRLYTDAVQSGRPAWKDARPIGSGGINEVTIH